MFILLLYSYDDRVFYANASCVRHGIPSLGRGTSTSDQQPRNEAAYSTVFYSVSVSIYPMQRSIYSAVKHHFYYNSTIAQCHLCANHHHPRHPQIIGQETLYLLHVVVLLSDRRMHYSSQHDANKYFELLDHHDMATPKNK